MGTCPWVPPQDEAVLSPLAIAGGQTLPERGHRALGLPTACGHSGHPSTAGPRLCTAKLFKELASLLKGS